MGAHLTARGHELVMSLSGDLVYHSTWDASWAAAARMGAGWGKWRGLKSSWTHHFLGGVAFGSVERVAFVGYEFESRGGGTADA
jgi:hypothetical protein